MSLALRDGWRSRPEATHPEVETLKDIGGVLARFGYFAYLWLLLIALAPLLWGWRPVVVTSGSMAPSVHTGDVVVAMPYDGQELGEGTVIVFSQNDRLVTHRIASVQPDGTYLTAGDANQGEDSSPVSPSQIEGVGRILVPTVGLPVAWVGTGEWYPMAWFGVMLVAFGLFVRARRGRRIRWNDHRARASISGRLADLERTLPPVKHRSSRQLDGLQPMPPARAAPGEGGEFEDDAPDPFTRIAVHTAVR